MCGRLRDEVTGVFLAEFGTFCFGDNRLDGGTGVNELALEVVGIVGGSGAAAGKTVVVTICFCAFPNST